MEIVISKENVFLKLDEISLSIVEEHRPYLLSTIENINAPDSIYGNESMMKIEELDALVASLNPENNKHHSILFELACKLHTGKTEFGAYNGEYWQTYRDVFATKLKNWITKDCNISRGSAAFDIVMEYSEDYLEVTSIEKILESLKKKWF